MLEKLLKSLEVLSFSTLALDITIVVVDNDPNGSSGEVCARVNDSLPYRLFYFIESQIGIPFARNRAVREAINENDYLVFVDDDETVDPSWLEELMLAQQQYSADVVAGPVVSLLPSSAPEWARAGKIFQHPSFVAGTQVHWCASNNVLVSAHVFTSFDEWFDERLALSGGSDRQFFERVSQRGFKIIWTDKAIAREEIPASRANIRWVLKRMYRQGISNAFSDIELSRRRYPRIRVGVRAVGWVMLGIVLLPVGLLTGSHRLVHYARYIAYGLGQWSALRGRLYNEYTVIHGQ
jgi:GT2 family glycosyltransferase